MSALLDGPRSKRFELTARLGEGTMGVVFAARDRERGTLVALKTLREVQAEMLARFKREFRALQDIHHPNLVSLGELVEEDGQWFFTMELVEGLHLLDWVRRADGRVDEHRLRAALRQLAEGLHALHRAGKVHRDVKPSNIVVTEAGRVVILDFGLIRDMTSQASLGIAVVGTAAYMSPEQAVHGVVDPSADWYSVGALLYEALSEKLPFEGMPLEILARKQDEDPEPLALVAPAAPADLALLAMELLARDPTTRPTGDQVLRRLGAFAVSHETRREVFIGRRRELAALREARSAVRDGHPVALVVTGEPGVGKSALCRHFAGELSANEPETVVFSARCFERETTRHKVADGLVDSIAGFLANLPPGEASRLVPVKIGLLTRFFPSLLRVPAIAGAPLVESYVKDPLELRARVMAVLRELLLRVCEHRPVVLVVDDLQWADADSLAVLTGLLRAPGAPGLLCLATWRGSYPPSLTGDARTLELGSLPREQAVDLATTLLGKGNRADIEALVKESGGHPLLLYELARHAASGAAAAGRASRLEDALAARLADLADGERRLLETIAVAGAPLPQQIASVAARLSPDEQGRAVNSLRYANLVRTSGARVHDLIEPLHSRVTEVVLGNLTDEQKKARHRDLAAAIEALGSDDDEMLSVHWAGAGEPARAALHARRAAVRAESELAFDRAARHYRLALVHAPEGMIDTIELESALGEALANAGRGKESAEAFLAAAADAEGDTALKLRRRAADQLLRTGHVDEGVAIAREVLTAVGLPYPETTRRALTGLLWRRARLRLRGVKFNETQERRIAPETLTQIDVTWALAQGLTFVDFVRSAYFQARQMQLALDAGEPYRCARAILGEANGLALAGNENLPRAEQLLTAGEAAAERSGHPRALAMVPLVQGTLAFAAGRWRDAVRRCDRAEIVLRERCTDVVWELASTRLFALFSLLIMGELVEARRRRHQHLLDEARERGDRLTEVLLRVGMCSVLPVAADEAEAGRREATAALGRWSHAGFQVPHGLDLFTGVHAALYTGDIAGARRLVATTWPILDESMLLYVQNFRVLMHMTRAIAAIAAASRPGSDVAALIRELGRDVRALRRERTPWSVAVGDALSAMGTYAMGRPAIAIEEMKKALAGLEASEYGLFGACCRRRLGEWLGGSEGDTLISAVDGELRSQGVRKPHLFSWSMAPGGPRPE